MRRCRCGADANVIVKGRRFCSPCWRSKLRAELHGVAKRKPGPKSQRELEAEALEREAPLYGPPLPTVPLDGPMPVNVPCRWDRTRGRWVAAT